MGIDNLKVQLVVGAFILPLCAASLCRVGHEYWSSDTQSCIDCSRCEGARLVIRPCQGHLDTVCGSLSDLNIDWSWLTNRPIKQADERHKKDHRIHFIDDEIYEKKNEGLYHGFDKSRLHLIDEDDVIDSNENMKHLGHVTKDINPKSKHHKGHDKNKLLASELFIADRSDLKDNDLKSKSISDFDDEKAWEERLIQSKNRLEHRKEDLIKTLHKGHKKVKLNQPSLDSDLDAIYFDDPINKHESHHKNYHKNNDHKSRSHISKQDLEIFQELVNQERNRDDILNLLEDKHIGRKTHHHSEKKKYSKQGYPTYAFDYRSLVPKHRMFLGEPSTVSEIMGQDIETDDEQIIEKEGKHHLHSSRLELFPWEKLFGDGEVNEPSVVAVPFTTAERFIWDWQAVALASAVIACLLFFTVTAIYSILHARQERRFKNQFDTDVEELSARRSLMQPHPLEANGADAIKANHYLENLLAVKKSGENEENVYTEEKQPTS